MEIKVLLILAILLYIAYLVGYRNACRDIREWLEEEDGNDY